MRKILALVLALSIALSLGACGQSAPAQSSTPAEQPASSAAQPDASAPEASGKAEYIMKVGYGTNPGHPIDLASNKLKELVEERSGGRIEVQLYPASQLGSERQLVEGLMAGTIECTPTTTGPMSNFDPQYGLFDLPYLFASKEKAYEVLDGPIGTGLLEGLDSLGLVGAAWWETGWRELSNDKHEIVTPADVKGLKIRVMENEVHLAFFQSLGAVPTPMGFGEIYMAAKTKTIDGQDNPTSIFTVNNFFEVQKYLTINDYVYSPVVVLFSKQWFDTLPEDLQKICSDTAYELREYQRQAVSDLDEEYLQTCKDNGVQITVLTEEQKKPWQEAAQAIYPQFADKIGKELLDSVINA
ncbi:DctP family TRAP transporter solute-binding subunit [Anaerotruncus rubiinfantis]|uniref:DctP family TRAP transporter solute-binding subunit n=1 Tax=Anaerotruncus rubiinfantis TaxID=1720200 RepID=UPI00083439FD|nr:DctP family TRAP transporter solute-binding subunit [Anaerotruncus rubiinfantis]